MPWGVFPHGTFLRIKQVERKRNTCRDVQQPSISVPRRDAHLCPSCGGSYATHGGEVDLTRPEERRKVHMFGADDVVVLGVPVYYGRGAGGAGLLDGLQGEETPAVLLAVYGNPAH